MLIKSDGTALRRPVLSPDGRILAVIASDQRIHLIDLAEAVNGRKAINAIKITQQTRAFVSTCSILRWSPEIVYNNSNGEAEDAVSTTTSECDYGKSWLLLSDARRVIALSTEVRTPKMMPAMDEDDDFRSNILADYDVGDYNGKLTLVEFVLDHKHALVMFELGSYAAILSLSGPKRDDITSVKFSDSRSLAKAPDSRYFALLRRSGGLDKVTVFELDHGNQITYKSFDCRTSDAQNVTWCPTGQPLLAIWDSPAYGVRVSFVTAQGHALRQFDISSTIFRGSPKPAVDEGGMDLSYWSWRTLKDQDKNSTLQIFANSRKEVLIRTQSVHNMQTCTIADFSHSTSVDSSKSVVWVESSKLNDDQSTHFERSSGIIDLSQSLPTIGASKNASNHKRPDVDEVDLIEPNADQSLFATRLSAAPRVLYLWSQDRISRPQTVLIFRHAIHQVIFHPLLPNALVIVTNTKNPRVYAWHREALPPMSSTIPIKVDSSTSFSGVWLTACTTSNGSQMDADDDSAMMGRVPFLLTSNAAFAAGYLLNGNHQLSFRRILYR
jgi:hypothetical protein